VSRLVHRSLLLAAAVAGLAAVPAGPAAAEGPIGGAGSPGNGTYVAYVEVTGSGVGPGGSLAGPPVSSGGGRVVVPSPCGYQRGETQQEVEAAYLEMAKGDEEWAKHLLLDMAHKMNSLSLYSLPNSTLKAQLQYDNWGKEGVWYDSLCDSSVGNFDYQDYVYNTAPPVLVNGGPAPVAEGPPDPEFLHDIAVRAMTLPDPAVQLVQPSTVVRLDTYVWVRPDDVRQREVTASAGGLSVTVTASAASAWFSSTGAPTVTCGPVAARTPACALVFARSSGQEPGQRWTITGHVDWTATSTAGLPVPGAQMDSAPQGIAVLEVQTVSGGSGGR
jgi:hypothetical protein